MARMSNVFSVRGNVSSADGKRGFCRNRENQGGTLYTLVYGKPAVVDIGPIEKALSIISSLDIFDYVLPVRVAI